MSEDPIAEAQRMLNEVAPKAASNVVEAYASQDGLPQPDLPLPDLLLAALDRLGQSGRIRNKGDNLAIKAICILIDELPDSEPQRGEIIQRYDEAWGRSSFGSR